MSTDSKSVPASRVIREELGDIDRRREKLFDIKKSSEGETKRDAAEVPDDEDRRLTRVRLEALEKHVVGLSFSGGGIRSGTFAVGVLQGLAQVGLLRRIDYLSTVSGGGYAGGWLAAWLKRDGDPRNVEWQLNPNRVVQAKAGRALLPPLNPGGGSRVVDEEPAPLHHLRQYSSYLTPRPGLLTADTWTVIAIWLRNVSVNLFMMLLPLTMLLVLTARIIVNGYAYLSPGAISGDATATWLCRGLLAIGLGFLIFAVYRNAMAIGEFRQPKDAGDYRTGDAKKRPRVAGDLLRQFLWPSIFAVVFLTIPLRAMIWKLGELFGRTTGGPRLTNSVFLQFVADYINANPGLLQLPNLVFHALLLGVLTGLCGLIVSSRNGFTFFGSQGASGGGLRKYAGSAFLAGASAGALIPLVEALTRYLNDIARPDLAATVIPPLGLLIMVAGLFVEVALLGRSITEAEREWWSRLCALLLIASLLWMAALASILYVPAAFLAAGPALRAALASGWLATTAFGILGGGRRAKPKPGAGDLVGTIAGVVPPIFLAGFLGAVSLFAASFVNMPSLAFPSADQDWTAAGRYVQGVNGASFWGLVGWLIAFGALYWLGNQRLDVNLFSLHAMYANRLVRCYLGASRPEASWAERWGNIHDPSAGGGAASLKPWGNPGAALTTAGEKTLEELHAESLAIVPNTPRDASRLAENVQARRKASIEVVERALDQAVRDANPETGFDPADDIPLYDLGIGREFSKRDYWGPLLLINTTLNLVAGQELAWRDRKGESFILTPKYCGSKGVGYAAMTPKTRENLTLGRAITISGAAVDPNMSFYQSWSLTAFLTIFNARLGQWMQNPRFPNWTAEGPKFGDRLVAELSGSTNDKDAFVHLSDGGHFENLGVYELIRRRCRYIIAVDAGEDSDAADDSLAQLTRLCRVDFGVRIELDTEPLEVPRPNAFSRAHVAVGRVHYEDVDSGQVPGIIVYIKISLTGDEPSDVLKYARRDPRFPHQPTDLRQSFTDEQFESYRALGDHIARDVFADAVRRVRDEPTWAGPEDHGDYIRGNQRLFSSLRGRWATAPADHDAQFVRSAEEWARFQREIRKEPALARLSQDLYPELSVAPEKEKDKDAAGSSESNRRRAELHAVSEMAQIMENAWINLRPRRRGDLPMDHGWMNVFRRWTGTKAFHRLWPLVRSEFTPEFVKFCESQLHLGIAGLPCHQHLGEGYGPEMEVKGLAEEFGREWPCLATSSPRDLAAMIERARGFRLDLGDPPAPLSPAWVLYQAPAGPTSAVDSPGRFPCGLILVAPANAAEVAARDAAAPPTAPTPDHAFELVAWVRRPHRSTGLGSRAFLTIFDDLKAGLKRAHPGKSLALTTRFPKWAEEGDQELAMWANFFALYDFKPLRKAEPDADGLRWTILEHRFHS